MNLEDFSKSEEKPEEEPEEAKPKEFKFPKSFNELWEICLKDAEKEMRKEGEWPNDPGVHNPKVKCVDCNNLLLHCVEPDQRGNVVTLCKFAGWCIMPEEYVSVKGTWCKKFKDAEEDSWPWTIPTNIVVGARTGRIQRDVTRSELKKQVAKE